MIVNHRLCSYRVEVEEILVHHPHLVVIGPFPWLLLEVLVLLESSALRLDKGKY